MRRCVVLVVLFGGAALAAEPKEAPLTNKDVGERMKAAHSGDKSPHARVAAELKKDAPDWAQLSKDATAFTEMGASLSRAKLGYTSPAKYVERAAALAKATGAKDQPAAVAAFGGLTKSCSACHYGTPK